MIKDQIRHRDKKGKFLVGHPYRFKKGHKVNLGKKNALKSNRKNLRKDRRNSLKARRKNSETHKGENNPNWKGGITPITEQIRGSFEYKEWRTKVFTRDNFTCVVCEKVGGRLEAHHIKRFRDYPELRFSVDNGVTLCKECHYLTNNYGKG